MAIPISPTRELQRLHAAMDEAIERLGEINPHQCDELLNLTSTGELCAANDPTGKQLGQYIDERKATLSPQALFLLSAVYHLRRFKTEATNR